MKRGIVLGLVPLLALALAACGSPEPTPTSTPAPTSSRFLVPDGASFVAEVRLGEIVADQEIAALYELLPFDEDQPSTIQGLLDLAQDETGIDLRAFSRVLIFGDTSRQDLFGAIATGTIDQDAFIESIEESIEQATGEEFSTSDHRGYKLRSVPVFGIGELAHVFLDEETLVFGTVPAVRQTIDVLKGDRKPLQNDVGDRFDSLGDSSLRLVAEAASSISTLSLAQLIEGFSQEESLPELLSLDFLSDIRIVAVAVDKRGEKLDVKVVLDFGSLESATDAGDVLAGGVSLLGGLLRNARLQELTRGVEVTASESGVTLAFAASFADLQVLLDFFTVFETASEDPTPTPSRVRSAPVATPTSTVAAPVAAPARPAATPTPTTAAAVAKVFTEATPIPARPTATPAPEFNLGIVPKQPPVREWWHGTEDWVPSMSTRQELEHSAR